MNMATIIKIFFFSFLFLSSAFLARPQEVDDASDEFSYDENAKNGPANWGKIWRNCNGNLQSPIDLVNKRVEVVSNLGILQIYYKPSNATLLNRGHNMVLRWDGDAGYLKINETQYQLQQVHWHTPSEHSIDGKRFDMEAHLVHMSSDGKIAVIGILYKIGLLPDNLLTILEGGLIALADRKGAERAIGIIDPNIIKLDDNIYYRYIGSLTTPPCTEGVVWTIDGKVNSVTGRQIKLLQDAAVLGFEFNARPIQLLNGRSIKFNKL
ncbi:bifunctional monodehydroascorbate reductase and carbonic anhydrase nectarin-3-like [Solanum dulcamara]|uniref:bifunctional monodehydroascorbate reductase and carbonic anhydrase nectarin-3-like n=1 Tax=Solanum dulcamara TaxID=45834 RepID=UPI002486C252|nr:bifunctional monodehydroascorbate reductase and carbonic anhydrase nectarin-3-like [Solanum dulcamara]